MTKRMVEIQQGKMQMANELDSMKTFHQFEYSNLFWGERTWDVVLEVDDFWEIIIFTHNETQRVAKNYNKDNGQFKVLLGF